ncbi:MAG: hypothetical protein ACRD8U_17260, partial [Pyrinomonadaceae bacterium]
AYPSHIFGLGNVARSGYFCPSVLQPLTREIRKTIAARNAISSAARTIAAMSSLIYRAFLAIWERE